jgi:ubiquinone/menaquinone biosynthesis C-methylase UbiE
MNIYAEYLGKAGLNMNGRRFRTDDPERSRWQNPEAILLSIGLRPGMVFMDIGCGDGYFALPAARMVGPQGSVYGVDIDVDAIDRLNRRAAEEGLNNLFLEVNEAETAVLCEECADIVFFGIDLHDFRDPVAVLRNAKRMLRATGQVVDLDWKDQSTDVGPPLSKRFSLEKAANLIRSAGFTVQAIRDAGPYHYLIIAGQ